MSSDSCCQGECVEKNYFGAVEPQDNGAVGPWLTSLPLHTIKRNQVPVDIGYILKQWPMKSAWSVGVVNGLLTFVYLLI